MNLSDPSGRTSCADVLCPTGPDLQAIAQAIAGAGGAALAAGSEAVGAIAGAGAEAAAACVTTVICAVGAAGVGAGIEIYAFTLSPNAATYRGDLARRGTVIVRRGNGLKHREIPLVLDARDPLLRYQNQRRLLAERGWCCRSKPVVQRG